jgi:hypothetical protein
LRGKNKNRKVAEVLRRLVSGRRIFAGALRRNEREENREVVRNENLNLFDPAVLTAFDFAVSLKSLRLRGKNKNR